MKGNIKTAMILAAGLGSRLKPLTDTIPKPLIEVQGKPMLDWTIGYIIEAGIRKIIINTHHLAEKIKEHIAQLKYDGIEIIISHEPVLLGSGGGILNAMKKFAPEDLVVINADAFFWGGNPVEFILNAWQNDKMDCLVLAHDKQLLQGKYSGDFNIKSDGIISRSLADNRFIMAGCSIFTPSYFNGRKVEFFTTPEIFFQSGPRYHAIANPYNWIDIGTHSDLMRINQKTI